MPAQPLHLETVHQGPWGWDPHTDMPSWLMNACNGRQAVGTDSVFLQMSESRLLPTIAGSGTRTAPSGAVGPQQALTPVCLRTKTDRVTSSRCNMPCVDQLWASGIPHMLPTLLRIRMSSTPAYGYVRRSCADTVARHLRTCSGQNSTAFTLKAQSSHCCCHSVVSTIRRARLAPGHTAVHMGNLQSGPEDTKR